MTRTHLVLRALITDGAVAELGAVLLPLMVATTLLVSYLLG